MPVRATYLARRPRRAMASMLTAASSRSAVTTYLT